MEKKSFHNHPPRKGSQKTGDSWRVWTVFGFLTVCFALVLLKLYSLQVVAYETYSALADNQHTIFRELKADRGGIFLRDGSGKYPIAVNRSYPMVFVSPREVKDRERAIEVLTATLDLERKDIEPYFRDMNDPFEVVRKKISDAQADAFRKNRVAGVHVSDETLRFYPSDNLGSQVVGFVGQDEKGYSGRYGVEAFWNEELSGKNGSMEQGRDPIGRWIPVADKTFYPASDGADIVLTIDQSVQYAVEGILRESVEKYGAEGGTIIVSEPQSGKLLAMANYPDFQPNAYSKTENLAHFLNNAVSRPYEPGSIFKPITMAIGLDTGRIAPSTVYTDTGEVRISGYTIKNSDEKAYGVQSMTQVLEKSLNTGTIFVEKTVGNGTFAEYVRSFGFGEKTGVDLPGESRGNIRNLDDSKRDINFYTASFGQGISMTPLQLVASFGALANGGKLMKPLIVDRMEMPDGNIREFAPVEIRKVIQESTARAVSQMLRAVVENGHGKKAAVPGYLIGGKTGTAQVAKENEMGYHEDYKVGSFIGFGPLQEPRFVILVKLDNPKNVEWAESSAAPAFGRVMSFLLEHYKIEPTEEYSVEALKK